MIKTLTEIKKAEELLINGKNIADEAIENFNKAFEKSKKITGEIYQNIIHCEQENNMVCLNKKFFDGSQ